MSPSKLFEPEPGDLAPCLPSCAVGKWHESWKLPMPAEHDAEGPALPGRCPTVIDAHVHLFPARMFGAIWQWFDAYGWPIRYKLQTPEVIAFLLARGVERIIALHYAHKPGIARAAERVHGRRVRARAARDGPRDRDAGRAGRAEILAEAFAAGLAGVKLHCHVQCVAPDDARCARSTRRARARASRS